MRVTREQWEILYRYQPADTIEKRHVYAMRANNKPEEHSIMAQREFQIRIECYDGEEFAECFTTKKEALKAYERRLQQSEYDCMIELLEVLAQDTIIGTNSSGSL